MTATATSTVTSFARRVRAAAEDTKATNSRCRCDLTAVQAPEDLRALGGGCTMPGHCCPRLDAVRRRVGSTT